MAHARDEQLSLGVVDEILSGVQLLQRLARRPAQTALARFGEAFQTRYEGREVPLAEALDEERGATGPVLGLLPGPGHSGRHQR